MTEVLSEETLSQRSASRPPSGGFRRWLFTANPFYVISTAFVIVGFKMWTAPMPLDVALWWLLGGLAVFTVVLSAVCVVLVRWGKVWEDARSLFFLLDLLFFFISASMDRPLQEGYSSSNSLPWIGLGFCIVTTESVLKLTRIILPFELRLCHHLCLGLTFLSPLLLVQMTGEGPLDRSLGLLALTTLWPIVFLLVLPSCRERTKRGDAPWAWPWMPLSPFVFLAILAVGRSYLLAIPFGPGTGYDVVLSAMHLAPLLWVLGVVFQKLDLPHRWMSRVGRCLPWVSFLLIAFDEPSNRFQQELQNFITSHLASPFYLALVYLIIHNLCVALRGKGSAYGATLSLSLAMFVAPSTQGLYQGLTFEWSYTVLLMGWCFYQWVCQRSSSHTLVFSLLGFFWIADILSGHLSPQWQNDLVLHGVLASLLWISGGFKDIFVKRLQIISLLMGLFVLSLRSLGEWGTAYEEPLKHLYMLSLTSILLLWSHWIRSRRAFVLSCFGFLWQMLYGLHDIFTVTDSSEKNKGPLLLFFGVMALGVGVAISLKKMNKFRLDKTKLASTFLPERPADGIENFSVQRIMTTALPVFLALFIFALMSMFSKCYA